MEQNKQPEKSTGKCSLYAVLFGASIVIWLWCSGNEHKKSQPPAERCLSAWDGSHPAMTKEVKAMLNDPASFKHLETRYIDRGQEIDLIMKFTGTNKFGGIVTNTARATIDNACNIISGPVIL